MKPTFPYTSELSPCTTMRPRTPRKKCDSDPLQNTTDKQAMRGATRGVNVLQVRKPRFQKIARVLSFQSTMALEHIRVGFAYFRVEIRACLRDSDVISRIEGLENLVCLRGPHSFPTT
eukprot:2352827-Pyramimonas_sp.AAC.1